MKKILTWGLVAFLIWFVVTQPDPAASILKQIGTLLVGIANGFGKFVSNLA